MSDHEHEHGRRRGLASRVRHLARPHSHGPADQVDQALQDSAAGLRVLWISLAVLGATARPRPSSR